MTIEIDRAVVKHINAMLRNRAIARRNGDFETADKIRENLEMDNITVMDVPSKRYPYMTNYRWKEISGSVYV